MDGLRPMAAHPSRGFAEEEREGKNCAWRPAIPTRLRIGDLLIRGKVVTEEGVNRAIERQSIDGGRLGDCLIANGAITRQGLDDFLHRLPAEPASVEATGVDGPELMGLLMKLIYTSRLETVGQFADAIKLPYHITIDLVQMAIDRKLLMSLGARDGGNLGELAYALTDEGSRWTLELTSHAGYVGPAPVTLGDFTHQVNLQKLSNEVITYERIRKCAAALTLSDSMIEQCGPAINSGRAMLLYGLPGNGKTSLAHCLASVFDDVIYVPYAIVVDGQIIRVFDPSIHIAIDPAELKEDSSFSLVRRDPFDLRWCACRRPFVIAGGELTLDLLDLRYDPSCHFYEAPLHMKAINGCFIIDDFGHQLISPVSLLNRWIVPLENRIDYLKLHTGKTFSIPFEVLIIFSTNLEPKDLMDGAFLRRLPYKIEVGTPSLEAFRKIFEKECAKAGLQLTREVFETIVYKIKTEKSAELACYQPKFIVDQVVAACRFMQQQTHFEARFISYAVDNLCVKDIGNSTSARAA